ncbi:MAG: hypothetical protein CBC35_09555 [Planctomycetes bacterium TMED75]|nr:hypothetical protein [Planctomycetaceae bacterium]OUU91452.1 MAG: hypothetical protein CBC35_09555 [Planctomycetes bacterium TMED75]
MRPSAIALCGLLALPVCSQSVLAAQDAPAAPQVTSEARALITRLDTFYKSLDQVTFESSLTFSAQFEGMTDLEEMSQSSAIAVGRPNLLRYQPAQNSGGIDAACNGSELTFAIATFKAYSVSKAPKTFQAVVEGAFSNEPIEPDAPGIELTQDPSLLIALSLFSDRPGLQMLQGVEKVSLDGEEKFNGSEAYKLTLMTTVDPTSNVQLNPIANATLWVAKGSQPWLLGIKPDFAATEPDMDLPEILLSYSKWKTGAPPEGYSIAIPEDWKKVDDVVAYAMSATAEELKGLDMPETTPGKAPSHPSENAAAPNFTLPTLDGTEEVTLSSLKGKVVVLDFWATWCAPCVAGLPTVDEVTKRFKDQGVVFYAIDVREKPERVSKFMKNKGWDFTVLMDSDGTAGKAFDVGGIPHSVVIDREGIIRHVHIGFGGKEALQEQLEEELTALTAMNGTDEK